MSLSVTIAGKQSLVVTPIGATVPVAITGNDLPSGEIQYKSRGSSWSPNNHDSDTTLPFYQYPPRPFTDGYASAVAFWGYEFDGLGDNYAAQKAALLASGFNWGSAELPVSVGWPSFTCFNGWNYAGGIGLGLARNGSATSQPYFIGRYRSTTLSLSASDSFGRIYPAGITLTVFILEVISSGTIATGKVIGTGADIDLPFPTTFLTDFVNIGNSNLETDLYFPIIGMTSADWIATNPGGIGSFGTHTQVSV